jgi:hypothetical protein
MSPTPLRVAYEVTEEDLLHFHIHHRKQQPGYLLQSVLALLLWGGAIVFAIYPYVPLPVALLASAVGVAAAFPLSRWSARQRVREFVRGVPQAVGKSTMEITPEGVRDATEGETMFSNWSSYQRIDTSPELLLFYKGPDHAVVVPRHAFPSPEAAETFLTSAKEWHAQAGDGTSGQ